MGAGRVRVEAQRRWYSSGHPQCCLPVRLVAVFDRVLDQAFVLGGGIGDQRLEALISSLIALESWKRASRTEVLLFEAAIASWKFAWTGGARCDPPGLASPARCGIPGVSTSLGTSRFRNRRLRHRDDGHGSSASRFKSSASWWRSRSRTGDK